MTRWDLKQALIREKLSMRVEARASATSKGLSGAKLLRFNQELSKKRLDAIVKRLKRTLAEQDRDIVELDTTQMKAIGASKGTFGVEDIIERRCRLSIEVADLKKVIKELYGRSSAAGTEGLDADIAFAASSSAFTVLPLEGTALAAAACSRKAAIS
jgi:hypothetical protein